MKMNKLLSSLVAIFVGVVLFAPAHSLAAAFGVSPPWIENDNMKPGSEFVYVINLSANELAEDMIVHAELEGDTEITKWLTVQNKDNLVMTKGQSSVQMSVAVNIPENAKIGKYNGNIRLSITPKSGNIPDNNIAILLGSNIVVRLGVIDYDITSYEIRSATTERIIEGQSVDIQVGVKNLGNTTIDNLMTKLSVAERRSGAEVLSISEDKYLNLPVYPHAMTNTKLSFLAPNLKEGEYWVNVEFFKDNQSIYKNRLYLAVEPNEINNAVRTAVDVTKNGQVRQVAPPAAPVVLSTTDTKVKLGSNANIETSVKVRAPLTNQLIMLMIGILLVLTGIVAKFYVTFRKKRR